jgi:hypothetical protein
MTQVANWQIQWETNRLQELRKEKIPPKHAQNKATRTSCLWSKLDADRLAATYGNTAYHDKMFIRSHVSVGGLVIRPRQKEQCYVKEQEYEKEYDVDPQGADQIHEHKEAHE